MQWHSAVDSGEYVDAVRSLVQMRQGVRREHRLVDTLRTLELLSGCRFDRRLARYVRNQKIHGDVLTVHVPVHPFTNLHRHFKCVQIVVELKEAN